MIMPIHHGKNLTKWRDKVNDDVMDYLYENRDHRKEWKGVPIDTTGKVRLETVVR